MVYTEPAEVSNSSQDKYLTFIYNIYMKDIERKRILVEAGIRMGANEIILAGLQKINEELADFFQDSSQKNERQYAELYKDLNRELQHKLSQMRNLIS
jgi:hypothetical protein